jgi:cob(II)yrinic acid a,c-diamide reductase
MDFMSNLATVDSTQFREAMSRFAAAVHVVTTEGAFGRRGLTVSAACSVSDSPATVLVCLNRNNPHNLLFNQNGVFALNILAEHHQPLANAFSGKDNLSSDERFAFASWQVGDLGVPVLSDALVSLECEIIDYKDVATHRVLFGEVKKITLNDLNLPIIYHHRLYKSLNNL